MQTRGSEEARTEESRKVCDWYVRLSRQPSSKAYTASTDRHRLPTVIRTRSSVFFLFLRAAGLRIVLPSLSNNFGPGGQGSFLARKLK